MDLKSFILKRKFQLYLQPVMSMESGRVTEAKASVKVKTKNRDVSITERFFCELKKTGEMYLFDLYVFQQVCELMTRWRTVYLDQVELAVEFAGETLEQEGICEQIEQILRECPGAASMVRILVSDTGAVSRWSMFDENCRRLSGMGLALSVNHCGSTETESSLLQSPYFDEVRIDDALIEKIETRTMDYLTVTVLANMCREEGKKLTARGIRSYEQYELLKQMGCGKAEGPVLGEAMVPGRFEYKYMEQRIETNII